MYLCEVCIREIKVWPISTEAKHMKSKKYQYET